MGFGIYIGDSQACIIKNNDADVIYDPSCNKYTPCLVCYTKDGVLVGEDALLANSPKTTVFGFKRMLGKTYEEVVAQPMFQNCPFTITKNGNDSGFKISIEIDGVIKLYKPEEILAHLLKYLYNNAKTYTGEDHKVVLCIPAYANDAQRQALKDSAVIGGLDVMRVINEVTSILISSTVSAYNSRQIIRNLVVRVGSYQTDISAIEIEDGIFEILDTKQHHFAGDKLDQLLMEHFMSTSLKQYNLSDRSKKSLLRTCKQIKHMLSINANAKCSFDIENDCIELEISKARFENMIQAQVDELALFIQSNFQQHFEFLHVSGGCGNIPTIVSKIQKAVGVQVYQDKTDPASAVCRGAGVQACLLSYTGTYTTFEYLPVPNRVIKSCGLYNNNSPSAEPIPSTYSEVSAEIVDLVSHVSVIQHFHNSGESPVEAVYLFPVGERAAICGFQVKIGDKEYQGKLYEKEKGFQVYDEAISESHGAFLMEKVDDNLFQVSIGNILPNANAIITIKYVTTLVRFEKNSLQFSLPAIMGIYDKDTQNNIASFTSLSITCEYSSQVKSFSSPTHLINVSEKGKGKSIITLCEGEKLNKAFSLNIALHSVSDLFEHMAWVSNDKNFGAPAALLSVPVPSKSNKVSNEYVFVIDRSGSMHSRIYQARNAILLFIKSLPQNSYFNIIGFGSSFEKLFPESKPYNEENVKIAMKRLETMTADLGGTEILPPLRSILLEPNSPCGTKKVILVTDGEVGNTGEIEEFVRSSKNGAQIYTLGIGHDCSRDLILRVARAGDGLYDFINDIEPMGPKVIAMLKATSRPMLQELTVKYATPQTSEVEANVIATHFDDKFLCYVHLDPNNFPPTQFHITSVLTSDSGRVNRTTITLQEGEFRNDYLVQLMAANAQIKKWEAEPKKNLSGILDLSLKFNLLSSAVSFVVVEKHNEAVQDTMMKSEVRKSGEPLYAKHAVTRGLTHDLLLLDVTPLDLGFSDSFGTHFVVIPRNSTIPTKKTVDFAYTINSNSSPELGIYEQRSNLLKSVPVPIPDSASTVNLNITFDIDANGILKVSVVDKDTGKTESVVISNDEGRLTKEQIEELIKNTQDYSSQVLDSNTNQPQSSNVQPCCDSNSQMMLFVRLQKLDGLWALDEDFISLFGEKVKSHPNKDKINSLVDNNNISNELIDTLWATSLAIAFFYSDNIKSKQQEWELIVDKSQSRLSDFISDEDKMNQFYELGKQGLQDMPPNFNSSSSSSSSISSSYVSSSSSFVSNSYGPTVEEVD